MDLCLRSILFPGSKLALGLIVKTLSPWLFAVVVLMCALGVCGETSERDGWYTSQQAAAGA
jgi:hypothetical protein